MIHKKVCMLGAFGVGKTSLVKRYFHSTFDERYLATLGARIEKQCLCVEGQDMTLMVWDFAGEDEILHVPLSYLRGASGVIVVADGTRPDTIQTAIELHERARSKTGPVPSILALNKYDLQDRWKVDTEDLRELRRRIGSVMRTSAKSGRHTQLIFETLAQQIMLAEAPAI
jgi:small GTP-binding protein